MIESGRRERAFLRECIDREERLIAQYPHVFNPVRSASFLKMVDDSRKELQRLDRWVQELEWYEQQLKLKPGLETDAALERLQKLHQELWPPPAVAPQPREKK
jgi:hypothetical protein